jgi:hypothetical protein
MPTFRSVYHINGSVLQFGTMTPLGAAAVAVNGDSNTLAGDDPDSTHSGTPMSLKFDRETGTFLLTFRQPSMRMGLWQSPSGPPPTSRGWGIGHLAW